MNKYIKFTVVFIIIIALLAGARFYERCLTYNGRIVGYKTYLANIMQSQDYLKNYTHEHNDDGSEDLIGNKETAVIVGTAILREHYPHWFKEHGGYTMDVSDFGSYWFVWGRYPNRNGGGYSICINKYDGKVLEMGLEE